MEKLNLSEYQPAGLFDDVHSGQTGYRDAFIMVCTAPGADIGDFLVFWLTGKP
ncbi:MAG TPA: hypothetical protein VLR44_00370 [Rhodoferax sp.]|nr:hypothetical protein [Rhodoferax sp.]HSN78810.1 hypothetical protein [Rhodoferax sp.]